MWSRTTHSINSPLGRITTIVLLTHLFLLIWSMWALQPSLKKSSQRLVVKNIRLSSPKPNQAKLKSIEPLPQESSKDSMIKKTDEVSLPQKPVPQLTPTPKPSTKPTIKKEIPQKAAHKSVEKTATKPKPIQKTDNKVEKKPVKTATKPSQKTVVERPKPDIDQHQSALLASAQEKIAKIESSRGKMKQASIESKAPTVKSKLENLHIDAIEGSQLFGSAEAAQGYQSELANRLKALLILPEHGEVKVKLKLKRSGKVSQVTILSAKSEINKAYIQNKLSTLIFPSFGDYFGTVEEYEFTISLIHE